jgi:hypothetical protein
MRFDPQVEAMLPHLLMQVLDAKGKRRGQLEYGQMAMFSSRGPISLDPGLGKPLNRCTALL